MSQSEKKKKKEHNEPKKRATDAKKEKKMIDGSSGKVTKIASKKSNTITDKNTSATSMYGDSPVNAPYRSLYDSKYKSSIAPNLGESGPWLQFLNEKGYKVIDKVGTGNYANVYKVRTATNKEMAVKIIDLTKVSKNYKTRFLPRELNVISKLQHKNIVEIYSIQKSSSFIFFFMEYTPNGTLGDFIRRNRAMPEWMCKPMFSQIVEALHYMHSLGMAHRDLKLENILLDKFTNPKLSDFSYSLHCVESSGNAILSQTFCGSVPYMPPEILKKEAYDPKVADIWSLGVCVFIMLNDRLPFRFQDLALMVRLQMNRSYSYKSRIDKNLSVPCKECIAQMLEPDVKTRITSIGLILHPWLCKI